MDPTTKITLSPQELQLVNDTNWILTKRAIIDKVYLILGDLSEKVRQIAEKEKEWLPPEVVDTAPKIYKGENYRMLPYVLLDYPRRFDNTAIFAIRIMFWWGNFFSVTLHLKGYYKKIYTDQLCKKIKILQANNYLICINKDEWQHHYGNDNYLSLADMEKEKIVSIIEEGEFIKLSVAYSFKQWDEMPDLLERTFHSMVQLLKP